MDVGVLVFFSVGGEAGVVRLDSGCSHTYTVPKRGVFYMPQCCQILKKCLITVAFLKILTIMNAQYSSIWHSGIYPDLANANAARMQD